MCHGVWVPHFGNPGTSGTKVDHALMVGRVALCGPSVMRFRVEWFSKLGQVRWNGRGSLNPGSRSVVSWEKKAQRIGVLIAGGTVFL